MALAAIREERLVAAAVVAIPRTPLPEPGLPAAVTEVTLPPERELGATAILTLDARAVRAGARRALPRAQLVTWVQLVTWAQVTLARGG